MVAIAGESNIIKSCECCNVDLHAGEVLKEEHELPSTCLLPPPLPTSSMGGKSHKHGGRFKHKHHLVRFTNPLPEATKHHHGQLLRQCQLIFVFLTPGHSSLWTCVEHRIFRLQFTYNNAKAALNGFDWYVFWLSLPRSELHCAFVDPS